MMDDWLPIRCKRFDGESLDAHKRRSAKITEIIHGFRMGHYRGEVGDKMERLLDELQTPALEHAV
jgi:hypothetical protein